MIFLFSGLQSSAQSAYQSAGGDLLISGTSTLHDWTMKSAKADCTATFTLNATGQIGDVSALSFSTVATSLKSGHSGMDDNAYKALKTAKNPTIAFTMTGVAVTPVHGGTTVTCKGKLTIAGVTRDEDVIASCTTNADGSISVSGTKSISMKLYDIEPPTFAFGTVKTGNDIVLTFHLTLRKA